MVDAEIELVVHPGGFHAVEERAGLLDQVVVVQEAAAVLLGAKACDDGARDGDERRGAIAGLGGAPARQQAAYARLLGDEALRQGRIPIAKRFRAQGFARLARGGAEDRPVRLEALEARERIQL